VTARDTICKSEAWQTQGRFAVPTNINMWSLDLDIGLNSSKKIVAGAFGRCQNFLSSLTVSSFQ
jgi:hypothetical protein